MIRRSGEPRTFEEQVDRVSDQAVANLLLEASGDPRGTLTANEIAAFRGGVKYALRFAQMAHDDALEELGYARGEH